MKRRGIDSSLRLLVTATDELRCGVVWCGNITAGFLHYDNA